MEWKTGCFLVWSIPFSSWHADGSVWRRSVMERDGRRMNGIPFSVITVSFADFMLPAIRLLGAVKRIDGFRQPLPIDDIAALQIAEREAEHVNETGERPDGE